MLIDDSGNQINPQGDSFGSGGEGEVYRTDRPGFLIKLYKKLPIPPREVEKLKVMVENPPNNAFVNNHVNIAWPISRLRDTDKNNQYVGFIMREVARNVELIRVYNPLLRSKILPNFTWYHLHVTALNFAKIVHSVHHRNNLICDIKPQNILVNDSAQVSIVDADSFQIRKDNNVYRCRVFTTGFIPPELIGVDLTQLDQLVYHDRYRVALIIYHILFTRHPFDEGTWKGSNDEHTLVDKMKDGIWLYSKPDLLQPNKLTIPLDIVNPGLKDLFVKCFNDGHNDSTIRPTTDDWINALTIAISDMKACNHVDNHQYSKTYQKCYWCDRAKALNYDLFPGKKPSPQAPQPTPISLRPSPQPPVFTPVSPSFIPSPQPRKNKVKVLKVLQRSVGIITAMVGVALSPIVLSFVSPGIAIFLVITGIVISLM